SASSASAGTCARPPMATDTGARTREGQPMDGTVTRIHDQNVVRRGSGPDTLADVLERVLDKGVVVVGDIGVSLLDIELLTLKVRLLIASADTAREMGIDWWMSDPFFSSQARQLQEKDQ